LRGSTLHCAQRLCVWVEDVIHGQQAPLIIKDGPVTKETLMFVLLTYFIIGVLLFAKFDEMNPYQKVAYGFAFPGHWAVGIWITASIKNKTESIWDNEPFLMGIFLLCLLLLASGS
jgi:hypothetical protein